MKILDERQKRMRGIAMQNLVVGKKGEKAAARKFLKDIGLSDQAINKIEGKQKVQEAEEICECGCLEKKGKCKKKKNCAPCDMKEEFSAKDKQKCVACNGLGEIKGEVCKKCSGAGVVGVKKALDVKNPPLKEEEVKDKVNSVESAQAFLKAKGIQFNKTENIGGKTVFKNNNAVVGAWTPTWGTVRTAEDLLTQD